jgi:hypothetical protein
MPNPRQKVAFLNIKSDGLPGNAPDRRQLPSHRYFGDLASATRGAPLELETTKADAVLAVQQTEFDVPMLL